MFFFLLFGVIFILIILCQRNIANLFCTENSISNLRHTYLSDLSKPDKNSFDGMIIFLIDLSNKKINIDFLLFILSLQLIEVESFMFLFLRLFFFLFFLTLILYLLFFHLLFLLFGLLLTWFLWLLHCWYYYKYQEIIVKRWKIVKIVNKWDKQNNKLIMLCH